MADRQLICKDCRNNFVFTERDQQFFQDKGFSDPVRCYDCRRKKREQRDRQDNRSSRY